MNGTRRVTRQNSALNDENQKPFTRTKAKAGLSTTTTHENQGLQSKNAKTAVAQKRRAALGDVSNVNKEKKAGVPEAKAKVARGPLRKPETRSTQASDEASTDDVFKRKRTSTATSSTQDQTLNAESEAQAHKKAKTSIDISEIPHDDLDCEDAEDPLMVSEYVGDIFEYLKKLEVDTLPSVDYMENQPDLTWRMRGILSDWLIEVHSKFRLLPETLFLAVNIIDRFLSKKRVTLPKLQLVGITALFIASKYEEVMCPSVQNFVYMADGGYSEEDILGAENYILLTLNFNLAYPNPMNFLRRISKADDYNIQVRTVGKYLVEIALLDHRFMGIMPSKVCAAGMLLAREMLSRGEWSNNLIFYSGYALEDLREPYQLMVDYLEGEPVHEAFFKKYASKKFMKASLFVRDYIRRNGPNTFPRLRPSSDDVLPQSHDSDSPW